MAKTYVLAGYDPPDRPAFNVALAELAKRDDVVIIHPQPGQSIEEAIAAQPIAKGDHIIVAAHGSKDGRMEWHKGELVPYGDAFEQLKQSAPGVATIAVTSCYGEKALNLATLEQAPPGAVVVSLVGMESVGRNYSIAQFSKELSTASNTVDIVLKALDNVDPQQLADLAAKDKHGTADPDLILPHTVGIGGHPPEPLNLNGTLQNMLAAGKNGTLNAGFMGAAMLQVTEHFDTKKGLTNGGFTDEIKLNAEIANVAAKIQSGVPLEGIEEKRIGYALAISYIDKSGELQQIIDKAQSTQAPGRAAQQAQGNAPTVEEVQTFLKEAGMLGADGKPLTVDGKFGPNSKHAYDRFCSEYGLDPAQAASQFGDMMAAHQKGALTKAELNGLKQLDADIDIISKDMDPKLQQAIRAEFADVRKAMMGSNNDHDVKAQLGELVATTKSAVDQQTGKGAARG